MIKNGLLRLMSTISHRVLKDPGVIVEPKESWYISFDKIVMYNAV